MHFADDTGSFCEKKFKHILPPTKKIGLIGALSLDVDLDYDLERRLHGAVEIVMSEIM